MESAILVRFATLTCNNSDMRKLSSSKLLKRSDLLSGLPKRRRALAGVIVERARKVGGGTEAEILSDGLYRTI